mgnify:CR=1 FL=1
MTAEGGNDNEELGQQLERIREAHRSGEEVQAAVQELERKAEAEGAVKVAAECHLLRTKNLRDHGSPYLSLQAALQARRRTMTLGEPRLEMLTHNLIGEVLWTLGEMSEARKVIEYGAQRARDLELEDQHAYMLARLALTFDLKEQPETYVQRNREALEATRALDSPDRKLLAIILGNLGNGLVETGQLDEAEEAFVRSREIGASLDNQLLCGLALIGLAEVHAVRGDADTWTELAREARHLLDEENTGFDLLHNMLDLVERAIDHGSAEAGLRELDSVREIVEDRTFHNLHAKFHELRADALETLGRLEEALEAMRESKTWRERHHQESISQLRRPLDKVVQTNESDSDRGALLDELARAEEARKELALAAYTDPLTQLPNRRAFDRRAPEEFRNAAEAETSLSMAIVDLDHFKRINDEYGHLVGDDALRRVADRIEDAVRSTDFVARLGGEEFAIIMPDTSEQQAEKVGERVRKGLQEFPILTGDYHLEVTASVGVTSRRNGDSLEALFERADDALYRAKEQGRNRVELTEEAR